MVTSGEVSKADNGTVGQVRNLGPADIEQDKVGRGRCHLPQSSSASRFTAWRRRPPRPGDPGKVAISCST
jgi:hypothetical protein